MKEGYRNYMNNRTKVTAKKHSIARKSMRKTKSVLVEWGLSYLLIVLIPFITVFVNYQYH